MNPYDATTHPGTHLVAETLDVTEVSTLNTTYRLGDPLYRAATRVIGTAYELDELHSRVTHAAKDALRLLEPVGRGEVGGARGSYALLRTAVPKLRDLLAEQDRAYGQLVESISAYRRLLPAPGSTNKGPGLGQKTTPDRDDDWAVAGERRLVALEAVEAGGVRFHRTAIGDDPYVSREKTQRQDPAIWPQTVQRLVTGGLLHQDTGEGLYRPGQLLSLTPQGEAALRDARRRHVCPPPSAAALPRPAPAPLLTQPPYPSPGRRPHPDRTPLCPPPHSPPPSPSLRSTFSALRMRLP
ncbi:large ATP-binding protein [Streptomyces sp. NPDC087437]|uniref:large ATP-binding protein n=1 Tax=Streptomyces sp. NPDC087437 TaxID=3365789 RepID=UPI0038018B34